MLTVVIPAYLEAGIIEDSCARIRAQLTHWPGTSQIVVVASDDETARRATPLADRVLRRDRAGKADAINAGVEAASDGVVVLTDANSELSPTQWPLILAEELRRADLISASKQEDGQRDGLFWAYERLLSARSRSLEQTLAVVGEFAGFDRSSFNPLPTDTLLDDVELAFSFAQRGLVVVRSPRICALEPEVTPHDQWERRVRIATGVIEFSLKRRRDLVRTAIGRKFLAHKFFRVSFGAAGFWLGLLGTVLTRPRTGGLLLAITVAAHASYRIGLRLPGAVPAALAPLALQSVAPAAWLRVATRAIRRDHTGSWKKVAR